MLLAGAMFRLCQRLPEFGRYPAGEADGTFGERTHAAVAAFQAREGLPGELGKWRVEWSERLGRAAPFENAARQDMRPKDLEAKGDEVMSGLGWLRKAAAGIAAFLGLDQAIDQAGVQLPQSLTGLRQVIDPLATNLAWLVGNRWALGLIGCIGLFVIAGWLRRRLTARYMSFRIA